MDFDQENQWWNPSSSSVDHDHALVAEAKPDEKSSIASTHKKRGGGRKINRRLSEVRDPNKKSTMSSGNPDMVVAAHEMATVTLRGKIPLLDLYTSVCPPELESRADVDIRNAAICNSWSSSSSGITRKFPVENPASVDKAVSNASMMDLWGSNVCCEHGNIEFVDEEAVFNMPGLVNSMAEGMLLTPPAMKRGFKWDYIDDDYAYLDLWGNS